MSLLDNLPLTSAFEQCLREGTLFSTRVAVCFGKALRGAAKARRQKAHRAKVPRAGAADSSASAMLKESNNKKKRTQNELERLPLFLLFLLIDHVPVFW